MERHNVEHDLFRILKRKDNNEVYYAILNMVNGTYTYEISYLNNLPYEELMIYLEKIIVIGSKCRSFETVEETMDAMLKFIKNKDKLKFRHLRKDTLLNIKYYFKVQISRLNQNKKLIVKTSSLLLATVLFFSVYSAKLQAGLINEEDYNNDIDYEHSIELDMDYDKSIEELESSIAYFDGLNVGESQELEEKKVIVEEIELTTQEKIDIILEKFNLNEEQFDVLCAIVMSEAECNSYEDAYAVINTIYNRTFSKSWNNDCNNYYGMDVGRNLYYQATMSGQFVVYENGSYYKNLGVREGEAFNAIIDFLYTEEVKHDYLSFRAEFVEVEDSVSFSEHGNNYFNTMAEDDRIELEDVEQISR